MEQLSRLGQGPCFLKDKKAFVVAVLWSNRKSTGIVTNTRITHATPAALYGHAPSRYWEDDSKVPPASRKSCKDLARQLIENDPGRNINENIVGQVSNYAAPVSSAAILRNETFRVIDPIYQFCPIL
ncbi:hypothetical protein HUJ04_010854 [Dendroctonus ponderosae]|nr:hypothetical protein HUJ04_010854 [Dendroctonus ponderosae]